MDGNLAATYALIHAFLIKRTHSKAAQALKKAVRDLVVLKDVIPEGPSLDEIVREWKATAQRRTESDAESPSSSSSSSSSSDDDSDSEIEQLATKPSPTKKRILQSSPSSSSAEDESDTSPPNSKDLLAKNKNTITERESSTLSSNGHSDTTSQLESAKPTVLKPESQAPSGSTSDKLTSSSTSDDESDEDSEPEANQRGETEVIDADISDDDCGTSSSNEEESSADEMEVEQKATAERKALNSSLGNDSTLQTSQNRNAASSSSSSSSESDSESDSSPKKPATAAAKKVSSTSTPPRPKNSMQTKHKSNSSKYESDTKTHTAPPAAKGKRVKEASGAAKNRPETSTVSTVTASAKPITIREKDETRVTKKRRMDVEGNSVATAAAAPLKPDAVSSGKNKKGNKAPRTTNNRFMRVDPTKVQSAMDNGYITKVAPSNDYGKRAHQDLIVTRGAGFRKEKNKKKKGSYRGGEITMESHSFKFTY